YMTDNVDAPAGLPGVAGHSVNSDEADQLFWDGYAVDVAHIDMGISLYWDKKAWQAGGSSFQGPYAHQTHWMVNSSSLSLGIPHSTRSVETYRVFYGYLPNTNQPTYIVQVVKNQTGTI